MVLQDIKELSFPSERPISSMHSRTYIPLLLEISRFRAVAKVDEQSHVPVQVSCGMDAYENYTLNTGSCKVYHSFEHPYNKLYLSGRLFCILT